VRHAGWRNLPEGETKLYATTTRPQAEPSIEQQLQNAREDFATMRALTESGATEIARLTAELAQANAMCESLAVSVQDLANAKAAVDEAHAIELQEVQKDAGRYRWLVREVCTGSIGFGGDGGWLDATDRDQWSEWIDANIPAAMTKEKPHGSL
jgi:light-regulated signal transduction histidine kinase (bacteriophytochrome)